MWELVPAVDLLTGLVMSVSSFLIMLLPQPLVEKVASASRCVCSMSRAVVRLLARDDSIVTDDDDDDNDFRSSVGGGAAPRPPRHCEQCALRGTSLSDVAAVVASLGLQAEHDDGELMMEEEGKEAACGGCAAMAVVDELAESKVAGEAELREAFYVFDRDDDGFVTPRELWSVMRRLGMPEGARQEDCRKMIAAHDGDGDGRISFREFRAMMENAA